MFCEHCGTQIDPNSQFCSHCGATLATRPAETRIAGRPIPPHRENKRAKTLQTILVLSIPAALIALIVVWLLSGTFGTRREGFEKFLPENTAYQVFSSGRYPSEMPPLSKFELMGSEMGECGFREKATRYKKEVDPYEGKGEIWIAMYKENASYPYVIMHSYMNHNLPVKAELWVYKKAAGSADEYFDNDADFFRKYPRFCQAIQAQLQVTIATVGGRELTFQVEVADTPAKRELGLQYRRELAVDRGMIFLFPAESEHSFWMKNTPIPLDMIFINKDRKIIGIVEQAVPFSTDSRSVPGASQFVLEINGGLSKSYGIKAGDSVRFQALSPESVKQ